MAGTRRIRGPRPGDAREIDGDVVIGREAVDLVLPDSEASRRHAVVRPAQFGVEVEDLGSRNGTFVNEQRVAGKVTVTESATLRIGQTVLQLEIDVPQPTVVRPIGVPPPTDVTREHAVPGPDVTAVRPVPRRPEVTVMRDQPAPAAGGVSAEPPPSKRRVGPPVLIGGGVAVAAVIAVVLLFVVGGSGKKAAAANPNCDQHFPNMIHDGFPEPPMIFSHDGKLNVTLTATTYTIHVDGHTDQGMEYNGMSPGPTLVMCRGDDVKVNLINKLPLPTNLHVHGLHVSPSGNSDNIFVALNPLQQFHYEYHIPLDQSPGSFWYHPHYHPLVDAETTAGMLGAIIVEGGLDNVMPNIPQRLIVIHGGKPTTKNGKPLPIPGAKPGSIKPPPNPGPSELMVNDAYQPTLHIAPGQLQRWRIWNATGERYVDLTLPGVTLEVLAYDGISLRYMRPMKSILIGPGERVEVLVRGVAAGNYVLNSMPFQPCFKGCFDPFGGVPQHGRNFGFQTLIHVVSSGATENQPLPTGPVGNPPDLRQAHVDVYRTIVMSRLTPPKHTPTFPLNGKLFNANRVDITMKLNSVEQWKITSPDTKVADEWHNFHIHTNPFQVVAIDGKPLNYILWADTINVPAGGSVTIRIHPIDFVGKSVFHCHVDFHEDNGMMGVFQILKDPPASEVNADRVVYMTPPAIKAAPKNLWAQVKAAAGQSQWARFELLCHLGLAS
jgi:suppressor of ftsI